ncbi:c-type cytochrome [Sphaerotilus sp.]|uniref:c-type cytochrome n=1 Tax=Sphaerotilus sp. TaxID=2093942 RepID=UPI0034E2B2D9
MKPLFALAALAIATLSSPVFANLELAQKKNCMACHQEHAKVIGPAYEDVAEKYAGQKDAVAKLADKVMKGGAGTWGQIPMPANAVTPDEAKQLVTWVLGVKKKK